MALCCVRALVLQYQHDARICSLGNFVLGCRSHENTDVRLRRNRAENVGVHHSCTKNFGNIVLFQPGDSRIPGAHVCCVFVGAQHFGQTSPGENMHYGESCFCTRRLHSVCADCSIDEPRACLCDCVCIQFVVSAVISPNSVLFWAPVLPLCVYYRSVKRGPPVLPATAPD